MKDENKPFLNFGRQNGKYNLSLEQLLEIINKIQKCDSEHQSLQQVQNKKLK